MKRAVASLVAAGALLFGLATPALADGRLVDAEGQRQWISCSGEGSPTAVLINGLGSDHTIWDPVAGRLERQTRVCVTDRPGLGDSPARRGSSRTDAGEHADELRAALAGAGESGPYLLIAHSYGGLIARAFAAQTPDEVAGVMLVDAVYPGIHRTFLPSYRGDWHEGGTTIDMDASEKHARGGPDLGDTPLVVIRAGSPGNGSSWADRVWNRQQRKAATLSSQSAYWTARKSGHVVQRDQPGIIVAGLRWLRSR
ncbi:MAG: alpha/beta hydrolase [Candidatus Nanopelagicales bacterium]|nr:alpha/beta hydrolase [Candidatus Nanopelagicales bacterium]MCF8537947.1 alpha/beta hydrolase [Candidatus Nanopelagicales bacterium]MCF8543061.1 alpha/beta hydrolase [Candidatus Nanopelagicales bacterium]MCF8556238.1 alpha/beta hydrolase [Candidatus Nanopelagicales bacterium]